MLPEGVSKYVASWAAARRVCALVPPADVDPSGGVLEPSGPGVEVTVCVVVTETVAVALGPEPFEDPEHPARLQPSVTAATQGETRLAFLTTQPPLRPPGRVVSALPSVAARMAE